MKVGKIEAEVKLDSRAYDELFDAYIELDEATEDMPWLNDVKERMLNAIKNTRVGESKSVGKEDLEK